MPDGLANLRAPEAAAGQLAEKAKTNSDDSCLRPRYSHYIELLAPRPEFLDREDRASAEKPAA